MVQEDIPQRYQGCEGRLFGGNCGEPVIRCAFLGLPPSLRIFFHPFWRTDDPLALQQVCTGMTGHAEVLTLLYEPDIVTYKDLVRFFFRIHDSTTLNAQGNDVGTQYRSAIFYYSDEQKKEAEEIKEEVQKSGKVKGTIVTEITHATTFYPADDYHQGYLDRNPKGK